METQWTKNTTRILIVSRILILTERLGKGSTKFSEFITDTLFSRSLPFLFSYPDLVNRISHGTARSPSIMHPIEENEPWRPSARAGTPECLRAGSLKQTSWLRSGFLKCLQAGFDSIVTRLALLSMFFRLRIGNARILGLFWRQGNDRIGFFKGADRVGATLWICIRLCRADGVIRLFFNRRKGNPLGSSSDEIPQTGHNGSRMDWWFGRNYMLAVGAGK